MIFLQPGWGISGVWCAAAVGLLACSGRASPGASAATETISMPSDSQSPGGALLPPPLPSLRQETQSGYKTPPESVSTVLTAEDPPEVSVHATSRQAALLYRRELMPLDVLARPFLGLAGYRVDPLTLTSRGEPLIERVEILRLEKDAVPTVWHPPDGALFDHVAFSPDGRFLSALAVGSASSRLVLFDVEKKTATALPVPVNAVWGAPCSWMDHQRLLCRTVPEDWGDAPLPRTQPSVVEHRGGPAPTITYSYLLEDGDDDARFAHYFTTSLAVVYLDGSFERIPNADGLNMEVRLSSNGRYALIVRLKPPFSRIVPAERFPRDIEIWDLAEKKKRTALKLPNEGAMPARGIPEGPTRFEWRPGTTSTLGWVDRAGGEDRWMALDAPFDAGPRMIGRSNESIQMVGWTTEGTPFYTTSPPGNSQLKVFIVEEGRAQMMWEGNTEDPLSVPGRALRTNGESGAVLETNGTIYFSSDGLSKEGPRPYLDSFNTKTKKGRRVRISDPSEIDKILAVLDTEGPTLLSQRETENEPFSLRIVKGRDVETVWQCPHPYPALRAVARRYLQYRRADGVELFGTLYLPPGYRGDGPLPTMLWIYPKQHTDAAFAEAPHEKTHRFWAVKGPSPMMFPLAGYALLLNPSMPIIGEGKTANDQYLDQLIGSAQAAVDTLVHLGVADKSRIAVGGRSYGAFSTANLLIHTNLFKTGIAVSGAYNRTLTPFGFQQERRSFWKATDVYARMSPFYFADRMRAPILLVHGKADENPGTSPLQSDRFFHALAGNGAAVRYVSLPFEGHVYQARESVLHIAAEMLDWLKRTL